jgi:3-isopropylmalate dehydrogenase
MQAKKIVFLPGDGIGPEVTAQAEKIVQTLIQEGHDIETQTALIGGAAIDSCGTPLPQETLSLCKQADAILFGAVGGDKWDHLELAKRPEAGLLGLRKSLGLFANLRPAILYEQLADSSSLKLELVKNLDILIVRELTGGLYFGEPRGIQKDVNGEREGYNTYRYNETEIRRVARVAFELSMQRNKKLCSVDKANVLEVTRLWREIVDEVASEYPQVELSHMYVDNAAMQLVSRPKQFDVILTGNMFGDILSDIAAMLTGSIGMLPSASLNEHKQGLYEPVHGSAPDIAGQDKANPIATILSLSMALRTSLDLEQPANRLEAAVREVINQGHRTADIANEGLAIGTQKMGDYINAQLYAK